MIRWSMLKNCGVFVANGTYNMRLVILTLPHVYANTLVKNLIQEYGDAIQLIIEPTQQLRGRSTIGMVRYYWQRSGWRYVFAQGIKLELFQLLAPLYSWLGHNVNNKFFSYRKLAAIQGIPVRRFADINALDALTAIHLAQPEIIVSVLFSQILQREILQSVSGKVINFHPAYLPYYKGISPIFWSMVNGESFVGATVHRIDEGVDTGNILAQTKIPITNHDTEDTLYWKCVQEGSRLLISVINALRRGEIPSYVHLGGSYFSFPTKEAVRRFHRQGKKFYRLLDLFK